MQDLSLKQNLAMLVYLDSAQFVWLERASAEEQDAFFSTWKSCDCELAFTLHHLQEIGQLSDRSSVERRLQVLNRFTRVRGGYTTSDLVTRLEIQFQLYSLLEYTPDIRRSALETLFPQVDLHALTAGLADIQFLFKYMQGAFQMEAEAQNLAKQAASGLRLNLRHKVDPSQIDEGQMNALFEEALEGLPPVAEFLMRQSSTDIRQAIEEQGTVRSALEAVFNLQRIGIGSRLHDSDLPAASVFFSIAREEVARVFEQLQPEGPDTDQLVTQLNPYRAPGFALRLAAQRARRTHPKDEEAGSQVDVDHLSFAPYVDLLIVDKRTFGFIKQEAQARPELLPPEFTRNVIRGITLHQVAEQIMARHLELQST